MSYGCYFRDYPTEVEFISNNVNYGYGGKRLGTATYYFQWYLTNSGRTTNVYSDISFTASTSNTVFSGSLYNGAKGVSGGGAEISHCTPYVTGAHGPVTVLSSNPYCFETDEYNYDHNMVSQISWYVTGYSGYWYAYNRSVVAHTTALGSSSNYTFDAVTSLPGNIGGSGYDPNG